MSSTVKIVSYIAMKGSVVHLCSGSFCALIYTLCIYSLKYVKLFRQSYTKADRCGHLVIHSHTLASISTQKIFVSHIFMASFITHSDVYFVASG